MNQKTTIQKIQLQAALSFCEQVITQLSRQRDQLQERLQALAPGTGPADVMHRPAEVQAPDLQGLTTRND